MKHVRETLKWLVKAAIAVTILWAVVIEAQKNDGSAIVVLAIASGYVALTAMLFRLASAGLKGRLEGMGPLQAVKHTVKTAFPVFISLYSRLPKSHKKLMEEVETETTVAPIRETSKESAAQTRDSSQETAAQTFEVTQENTGQATTVPPAESQPESAHIARMKEVRQRHRQMYEDWQHTQETTKVVYWEAQLEKKKQGLVGDLGRLAEDQERTLDGMKRLAKVLKRNQKTRQDLAQMCGTDNPVLGLLIGRNTNLPMVTDQSADVSADSVAPKRAEVRKANHHPVNVAEMVAG